MSQNISKKENFRIIILLEQIDDRKLIITNYIYENKKNYYYQSLEEMFCDALIKVS